MTIGEVELNRKVVYTDGTGKKEEGIITSSNSKFVFVRYGNDVNSKATRPEDIDYI